MIKDNSLNDSLSLFSPLLVLPLPLTPSPSTERGDKGGEGEGELGDRRDARLLDISIETDYINFALFAE